MGRSDGKIFGSRSVGHICMNESQIIFFPARPNSINNRDSNFTIWALTRFWNFENWLLSYIFSSQNEKKPIIHRNTWLTSLFCLLLSLIFGNISEQKPNRCTRLSPLRSTTTLRLMNTAAFLRDLKKQRLIVLSFSNSPNAGQFSNILPNWPMD